LSRDQVSNTSRLSIESDDLEVEVCPEKIDSGPLALYGRAHSHSMLSDVRSNYSVLFPDDVYAMPEFDSGIIFVGNSSLATINEQTETVSDFFSRIPQDVASTQRTQASRFKLIRTKCDRKEFKENAQITAPA